MCGIYELVPSSRAQPEPCCAWKAASCVEKLVVVSRRQVQESSKARAANAASRVRGSKAWHSSQATKLAEIRPSWIAQLHSTGMAWGGLQESGRRTGSHGHGLLYLSAFRLLPVRALAHPATMHVYSHWSSCSAAQVQRCGEVGEGMPQAPAASRVLQRSGILAPRNVAAISAPRH